MRILIQNPKNAATNRAAQNFILSATAVLLAAAVLLYLAGDAKIFLATLRSIGNTLRAEEPLFYYALLGTLILIFRRSRRRVLGKKQKQPQKPSPPARYAPEF